MSTLLRLTGRFKGVGRVSLVRKRCVMSYSTVVEPDTGQSSTAMGRLYGDVGARFGVECRVTRSSHSPVIS